MADDVDLTSERAEREHETLLRACRKPEGPPPNGHCHYCDEPVEASLRYCSVECRDDDEREKRLRKLR